jgi:hypothetical protein
MEIEMTKLTASIYFQNEKPYGVGRTANERASRIVGGWRGEVIGGLEQGLTIYTGVCSSREQVKAELISHLKAQGLSGTLSFV